MSGVANLAPIIEADALGEQMVVWVRHGDECARLLDALGPVPLECWAESLRGEAHVAALAVAELHVTDYDEAADLADALWALGYRSAAGRLRDGPQCAHVCEECDGKGTIDRRGWNR